MPVRTDQDMTIRIGIPVHHGKCAFGSVNDKRFPVTFGCRRDAKDAL
jgi:hypothetical protein